MDDDIYDSYRYQLVFYLITLSIFCLNNGMDSLLKAMLKLWNGYLLKEMLKQWSGLSFKTVSFQI